MWHQSMGCGTNPWDVAPIVPGCLDFCCWHVFCEFYSHLGKTDQSISMSTFSDGLVKQMTASEATCDFQFAAHFWGVIIVATISRWWIYIFVLVTPNPWGKDPI